MKILIVNDYEEKIAGAEIYLYNIMDELQSRGHEVVLFSSKVTKEEYKKKITNLQLRDYMKQLFNFQSYKEIKSSSEKFAPDVVHVHGIFNELSPSIFEALKKYPIVMTVHNNQIVSPLPMSISAEGMPCQREVCRGCLNCVGLKGTIYEMIKRPIHKFLLRNVTQFIAPSNYMKRILNENGFRNVLQIYNGTKLLKSSPLINQKNILYLGRLTHEKGLEILIQAVSQIRNTMPEIKLTIVGEGKDSKYFKNKVKELALEKNVSFEGAVSNTDIVEYYKKATLVCIPSLYPDNLPTVGIEAMSIGRILIGANTGGIPELLIDGKTGFLFEKGDEEDLVEKIKRALENQKLLNDVSKNAQELIKHFEMKHHIDVLENMYQNVQK